MHIRHLQLAAPDLAAQQQFYRDSLGFAAVAATPAAITVQTGAALLTFTEAPDAAAGRYHLAFAIPANQLDDAQRWLAARAPLLAAEDGASRFVFPDWDAESVYCYDPAGNIVEFIARRRLADPSGAPFAAASVRGISEIGLVADDVQQQAARLQAALDLPIFDGAGSETFTALGDDHGLCIVVRRGRRWFPTPHEALGHGPITLTVGRGGGERTIQLA